MCGVYGGVNGVGVSVGGKRWGANAMSSYVLCAWFCQA